ncbi:V-set and transmembrane domain-containing protein 4a isoform X3 [Archocentrus centrarchus]|uniref:V-set and transmembrane domain-containing protein 4a isoform X3 n=1 Tax=Archocentrus centrarchus TaxID=63155 RepID=UPI0011EA500A|nr:V-set and transmembrane domain-containing protein 4-like isoform X3 [Archocentrus centrarchus]
MYFSVVVLVLTKALVTEVCHALNVTVTPGPVVLVTENNNLTLSCLVSQRRRNTSVLILRWFFSPLMAPTPVPPVSFPPTSPPVLKHSEFLIVKMGIRKRKLYGNYTHRFPQPKFHLHEEMEGDVYQLRILSVTGLDQGFYSCKVQEIRKHRNTWRISSNGTSTTQLAVHFTPEDGSSEGLWLLFAASYPLVKCPESSSGETVTSSSSCSSSSPSAQRKDTRQKTDRAQTVTPPKLPEKIPLHIPAKVPIAAKRPQKPRRLKAQSRRSATPRVSHEESLTYAELELVRPRQEPPAASSPDPAPSSPDTVYAQILFQEK